MNYDEAIEYIETVSCSGIMPGTGENSGIA